MLICFLQTLALSLADVESTIDPARDYAVYGPSSQILAAVLLPRPTTRVVYTVPVARAVVLFPDAATPVGSEVFVSGQDAYDYYEGALQADGVVAWTVCR